MFLSVSGIKSLESSPLFCVWASSVASMQGGQSPGYSGEWDQGVVAAV